MTCVHAADVGSYVLNALPDDELRAFQAHLDSCADCRIEVGTLQSVVDTLPMAAPQHAPDPALKARIMNIVESEAELLRASGPEADRVAAPRERRRFGWGAGLSLRPLTAGALASALIAVGVIGGTTLQGDSKPKTRVVSAQVSAKGAKASLIVTGSHGSLKVVNLPSAPYGEVYQVWLQRSDSEPVVPTHTLFNVRKSDGSAVVPIEESIAGVKRIMVTPEPDGGSASPTGDVLIQAKPA